MFLAKLKSFVTFKRCVSLFALTGLIVMNLTGFLMANEIRKSYGADQVLQRGMIVGYTEDDTNKVEPINVDQMDRMLGVVVNPNDSPITLTDEQTEGGAIVATGGNESALVSDQNGDIKSGDYVTASSLNGIGMLATYEEGSVIGRAIDGFNGKDGIISTSNLQDTDGNTQPVNIGRIRIDINIGQNPVAKSAAVTPEWLGKVGQAIAGKSLSPARIYISAALFVIGAFIAGAILYAGIRSSIISIGRNPLSKKSILRGLLQVIFTSLIVFIISVGGVYLLLRV